MNLFDCSKYIRIAFLCLAAFASTAGFAENSRNDINQEFGSSLQYPMSWTVSPPLVPDTRIRMVSSTTIGRAE
jgi:hypothetical protein